MDMSDIKEELKELETRIDERIGNLASELDGNTKALLVLVEKFELWITQQSKHGDSIDSLRNEAVGLKEEIIILKERQVSSRELKEELIVLKERQTSLRNDLTTLKEKTNNNPLLAIKTWLPYIVLGVGVTVAKVIGLI